MQTSHVSDQSQPLDATNSQNSTPDERHKFASSGAIGVRSDLEWSRSRVIEKRLTNYELACAIDWQDARRGAPWSKGDARSLKEAVDRSWGLIELQNQRWQGAATWVRPLLPKRRSVQYIDILSAIISAYRVGAIGLMISQVALAGYLDVSEQTVRRWVAEMERLGLVRCTQTWQPDPKRAQGRMYGPTLYRVGPTLLEGEALLDGAPVEERRSATAARARIDAAARRREMRRAQDERIAARYELKTARRDDHERCQPLAKAWEMVEEPKKSAETILLEPAQNVLPIPPPSSGVIPSPRRRGGANKRPPDSRRVYVRYVPTPAGVGRAPASPRAAQHAGRAAYGGASGRVQVRAKGRSTAYVPAKSEPIEPIRVISAEERERAQRLAAEALARLHAQRDPEAVRAERRSAAGSADELNEHTRRVLDQIASLRPKSDPPPASTFFCASRQSNDSSGIPDDALVVSAVTISGDPLDFHDPYAAQRSLFFRPESNKRSGILDPRSEAPIEALAAGRSFLAGLSLPSFQKGKK